MSAVPLFERDAVERPDGRRPRIEDILERRRHDKRDALQWPMVGCLMLVGALIVLAVAWLE